MWRRLRAEVRSEAVREKKEEKTERMEKCEKIGAREKSKGVAEGLSSSQFMCKRASVFIVHLHVCD